MRIAYHPEFRFQGKKFAYDDLWDVAYSLVKEGDKFERSLGDFILDWVSDREYLLQQTSGSTGAPKTIRLQKKHLVHSARATGAFFKLGPGSKALDCLPLTAVSGKMMWIRAMVLGWDITGIPAVSDPLREVSGSFDVAAMVPLQVQKSLPWLHRIGTLLVGGAPIPSDVLAQLPTTHKGLWQTYGMTETGSHIALRRLSPLPMNANPESILPPYIALEGVQLELDERGCLRIDAPGWLDNPLHTNDMVYLESPTSFRWLGRYDHVVNSGGVKLLLEDLEQRMSSHISERFILAGVPDPKLGERLILVIESDGLPFDLLAHLQGSPEFSKFECPRELFHVSRFAETPTGKIDRLQTLSLLYL
jgi:O-succinylbenzoic acid--CoA ligase